MIGTRIATRRVCVVAEELAGVADEGGRNFAAHLTQAFSSLCETHGLSVGGPPDSTDFQVVPASRSFVQGDLRNTLRSYDPDLLVYVPSASLTLFSFLRLRLLSFYAHSPRTALVAHQPRSHLTGSRSLIRSVAPDAVFSQDASIVEYARGLGCRAEILPPAVDLTRFRPVDSRTKHALRRRFGLAQDAFVMLHVGHLKPERNLQVLTRLTQSGPVLVVAGASTGMDATVLASLQAGGVRVLQDFIPDIESVYQASDCYLFPVSASTGAIGLPLSVLEAMATDLPVLAHPFGALPSTFEASHGLRFAADDGSFVRAMHETAWMAEPATREKVAAYSWEALAEHLIQRMES